MQSFNISLLSCRIIFLTALLFPVVPVLCVAEVAVDVVVSGIESPIYENVLSNLSIYLQKDNKELRASGAKRLHGRAIKDIREALAPFGYYNPVVESSLKKEDKVWHAEYIIKKGQPLLIENVELGITGVGNENDKLLAAQHEFPLKKGDILNQIAYEDEKKRLVNLAISEGYLDAVYSEKKLYIDPLRNRGSIHLTLYTGKQYFFGETSANKPVLKRKYLNRYLPYRKGDPYSRAKLFELQSILYQTDYFSRVVVQGNFEEARDYEIPVEVDLQSPEHLNKYSFGIGYATDTGIRGKIDWANRLFNDRGHRISASLQLAELENTVTLTYDIPRENPRYDKIIHSLAYQDKVWDETTTRLLTGAVSREYSGPRFKYSAGIEIRDEVYDVGETSGTSTLFLPSLNGGFVFADDIMKTKYGLQASVGLKGALEGVVSDVSFLQGTVNAKAIITPLKNTRVIGRISVGATLVDSIDALPPSLRFYTGGDSTIRGYRYKSIGTEDASGAVIGGRYLVVESIEVEHILGQYWSLAAFWDGGTATDDLSLDYHQGVGGGIRFRLPFGQIRFDVASAVTKEGNPIRVHLAVGGDF